MSNITFNSTKVIKLNTAQLSKLEVLTARINGMVGIKSDVSEASCQVVLTETSVRAIIAQPHQPSIALEVFDDQSVKITIPGHELAYITCNGFIKRMATQMRICKVLNQLRPPLQAAA